MWETGSTEWMGIQISPKQSTNFMARIITEIRECMLRTSSTALPGIRWVFYTNGLYRGRNCCEQQAIKLWRCGNWIFGGEQ